MTVLATGEFAESGIAESRSCSKLNRSGGRSTFQVATEELVRSIQEIVFAPVHEASQGLLGGIFGRGGRRPHGLRLPF